MMPKSELKARLATRKAHRADAPVCKHKGEPGQTWVAGNRADNPRYYGNRKACDSWNKIEHNRSVAALRVVMRIREGEGAK